MWPQGTNCSFLIGVLDYFDDIQKNQSLSLTDNDKTELNTICGSLNRILLNSRNEGKGSYTMPIGPTTTTKGEEKETDDGSQLNDPYSLNKKVRKFFEWSQTYISINSEEDHSSTDWQQLVGLYNFQFPHYAIPSDIDVTTYHASFLCKYCKDKGNELMKNKKIKQAIEMYTKAIQLLEKEKIKEQEILNNGNNIDMDKESDYNDNIKDKGDIKDKEKLKEKDKKSNKSEIAIIYCNRSAAYVYLQEYQKAVDDAVCAVKYDPLLTKAWIRKGMAEQELQRFEVAYGDYQVALNQSKESDNYYKFLIKKIKQCFDQILIQHTQQHNIHGMNDGMINNAMSNTSLNSPHSQ